jgi:hypothetical protein
MPASTPNREIGHDLNDISAEVRNSSTGRCAKHRRDEHPRSCAHRDNATNEVLVTIHWNGGRHTELRYFARADRTLGGRSRPELSGNHLQAWRPISGSRASSDNKPETGQAADGNAWTIVRVRELRERLGSSSSNPTFPRVETIGADTTAIRVGICLGSVHKLIREGVLPATHLKQSAPWEIPVESDK